MKIDQIISAKNILGSDVVHTPMLSLCSNKIKPFLFDAASVKLKLEIFQHVGSFKARGVLLGLNSINSEAKKHGVVAVSAGNHALAVSWASNLIGINAKVIMPKSADTNRIEGCKAFGADLLLVENAEEMFAKMEEIASSENRVILHPFEADHMISGSATCGLEMLEAMPEMEQAIIPIGGGGLISGIALAIKAIKPTVEIFGVEPYGADSMFRSLSAKEPVKLKKVETIADSLGSPMALPKTFKIIRNNISGVVRLTEKEIVNSMVIMQEKLNLLVEPACATSLAALMGPLRDKVVGKNVALIACGSNISAKKYADILRKYE